MPVVQCSMELQASSSLLVVGDCDTCLPGPATSHEPCDLCLSTSSQTDTAQMVDRCRGGADPDFRNPSDMRIEENSSDHVHLNSSESQVSQANCLLTSKAEQIEEGNQIPSEEMDVAQESGSSMDYHYSYFTEIYNYITKKYFPTNLPLSHQMLLKKRSKHYCVKDGILFYGRKKVVSDKKEQLSILEKMHVEEKNGVHLGVKKMSSLINSQYFWRGQYFDITNYVRQCKTCTEIMEPINTQECIQSCDRGESSKDDVWQKVEVNIHGPYAEHGERSIFILTMVDPVSHFVTAKQFRSENCAVELASFIFETFCSYGFAKCILGKTCRQYVESVKQFLRDKNNSVEKMLHMLDLPSHPALQDSILVLPDDVEGQYSLVQTFLEPFVNSNLPFSEADLLLYVFKLNSKSQTGSPFSKMFGRAAYSNSEDDKENADINILINKKRLINTLQRRQLRSSTLQCRHCAEVFTSKISFRIHQRKHTEEARRRGMLEGQAIRFLADRERRALRARAILKPKHLHRKRCGNMQYEDSSSFRVGKSKSLQGDIPDGKRAELRANAVQAVLKLLATSKDSRKRRGKYKKFSSEIQEEMAHYAAEHGCLKAVQHFSEKLGVVVSESTVRNIVKWYQCFTPEVKEEIGRFAAAFGIEAAASHFSERLGREIRYGLIRKFKKLYSLRYPDLKQQGNKNESTANSAKKSTYSDDVKEAIGHYAAEHSVQATIAHFAEEMNLCLKEQMVRRCRKIYQDKCRSVQEQHLQQQTEEQQQQEKQQPEQPQLQEPQLQQPQLQQPQLQQHDEFHSQQTLQQLHTQHQQLSNQHPSLLHQHQEQLREPHQQRESLHISSLPASYHSQPSNVTTLQEASVPSSSSTVDILHSSLSLLNHPQLNNPATIIYNNPYQGASSHIHSAPQLIPISQQQSPSVTFHTVNHCNSNTAACSGTDVSNNSQSNNNHVQTSMPLTYQTQPVPISASVIINQNVATVQAYPGAQVYPAFAAPPQSISAASLSVPGSSIHIPQPTSQQPTPLTQQSQPLHASHTALSAITVAVAPAQAEQRFHQPSNQAAVVVSQPVPSHSILVSHPPPGTALLQHIIEAQPHLQTSQTHLSHQLISGIQSASPAQQAFPHALEQHHQQKPETFSHTIPGNLATISFETPTPVYEECRGSYELQSTINCGHQLRMKEVSETYQSSSNVSGVQPCNVNEVSSPVGHQEIQETVHPEASGSITTLSVALSKESSKDAGNADSNCLSDEDNVNCANKIDASCLKKVLLDKSTSARKAQQKKDKQSGQKVKGISVSEQKRGTYAIYSPEVRAEMGKYAAEHGSQRACDYFKTNFGYSVAESTMRGLRDKYLRKREMCCGEKDKEVTSLGYAPRGRPMRLGQYDEVVQECIQELAKSGVKISSFLAIATARHVLMQHEPHLLEENGGKIKLNVTWAKSFLKRSGIKNHS